MRITGIDNSRTELREVRLVGEYCVFSVRVKDCAPPTFSYPSS